LGFGCGFTCSISTALSVSSSGAGVSFLFSFLTTCPTYAILEEDRILQAMILYMEEGKASWAHGQIPESGEPPTVGTTTFQRKTEINQEGVRILMVIAYRHGEEIHRFTTYLLPSSQ